MPFDDIAPMVLGVITMLIPIVAILTHHQRKMAELIHGRQSGNQPQTPGLEHQLMELRQAIHQQTLMIDNLSREVERLKTEQASGLETRLQANISHQDTSP